ncbi:MAG: SDR family oxidoreductase [Bacteroidota bacterium]
MKIDFSGKNVLVTGASRGIGRATAIEFAECGAHVIVHYKENETAALKTLSMLPGEKHFLLKADLSDSFFVEHAVFKALRKAGRIDILVNNAGIFKECDMLTCNFEEWQLHIKETLQTNFVGLANLTYLVGRHMASAGGGKIINVSSRGAFRGEPHAPAYGASKAAVNQFNQSLAQLLAPKHVFVYAVAPGFVETEMSTKALKGQEGAKIKSQSPLNRVAKPEEVAHAIVLLASDKTEFMTGCILDINGASYLRS